MVSGPINCVKYLVFIFNLIFFLFGITLVAVGAYVQYQLTDYLNFFDTKVNGPAILLIIIGLVIFVISFFGCCGAIKENYCMVLTYSILMMLILVCQIGGAIAGFVYSSKINEVARNKLLNSMKKYNDEDSDRYKDSWDVLQQKLTCCGTKNPDDWKTVDGFKDNPPQSCCNGTDTACSYAIAEQRRGCQDSFKQLFEKNVYYIGAVGIALAVIQVTGIVLSCCLARAVRKEYEVA